MAFIRKWAWIWFLRCAIFVENKQWSLPSGWTYTWLVEISLGQVYMPHTSLHCSVDQWVGNMRSWWTQEARRQLFWRLYCSCSYTIYMPYRNTAFRACFIWIAVGMNFGLCLEGQHAVILSWLPHAGACQFLDVLVGCLFHSQFLFWSLLFPRAPDGYWVSAFQVTVSSMPRSSYGDVIQLPRGAVEDL